MILPVAFDGVRVIVWDLDDTLWSGTLDDGDDPRPTGLHEWVEPLARAGVMSAVCSNNDPDRAREQLARWGVLDWVVFPQVSWRPKKTMLAELLADLPVRAVDVLLVDDQARHRHLAETEFGMRSADPTSLPLWTGVPGTDQLSDRLAHYRVLEKRARAARSTDDLDAFLRGSEVTVTIGDPAGHEERVAQLSQRANQLNFTGSRLDAADVRALCGRGDVDCGAVWARDRYGDYGLAGFYAHQRGGPLLHFFFSCRVLHLGVEAHVYALLGRPGVPDGSATVRDDRWAELAVDATWVRAGGHVPEAGGRATTGAVFWAGGCDLQILAALLPGADEHPGDTWVLPEEQGGAQVYARSSLLVLLDDRPGLFDAVPWSRGALRPGTSTVVLSPWVDCACLTYTHRESGVRVPSFVRLDDSATSWDWEHWWGANPGRAEFQDSWTEGPPLTAAEVESGVLRLAESVAPGSLVVLTVPEIDNGRRYAWGEEQLARHRTFNRALEAAAASSAHVRLVDVRTVVQTFEDLHSPVDPVMFHYRRDRYVALAALLDEAVSR